MYTQSSSDTVDPDLLSKIERKQRERQESFSKLKRENILDEKAIGIVKLSVEELLARLQTRQLSAEQVLRAYIAKALQLTEKFNCVTEFIPKALDWASALDSRTSGPPLPLHGLPVAVKDDHNVEGLDSTLGFAKNLYQPARESAALVKILLKLGAVPFAKTNVPQSLFSSGNDNPIFGSTLNAHNPDLAPGGSSSGSGCIVAAGGAAFATGSDLGGSLRIPAHFHGVATLRPTVNRLSAKGIVQCVPDLVAFTGVPGIIAPDARILSMVWKSITEDSLQNQYDPLAVPLPWNETLFSSRERLRVGYFTTLPFFPAFEDTQKTVLAAKSSLEARGHKVVPFQMFDDYYYIKVFYDLLLSDKGEHLKKMFEGEPISYCVAGLVHTLRNPGGKRDPDAEKNLTERERIMWTSCGDRVRTADDLSKRLNEKKAIILDILERMKKSGVDVLISPAYPFPAVHLVHGNGALSGALYLNIWNFVDFPAGVVRFGTESGNNIDSYDDQGETLFKRAKMGLNDSSGMPINVQVISTPFKEELVLKTMIELEDAYESMHPSTKK